jgi:preprotein translocase subunit Sec63
VVVVKVVPRSNLPPSAPTVQMLPLDIADAYKLLGITTEAREDEINKAFRQRSLKVHPDRNPDNPEAGSCYIVQL